MARGDPRGMLLLTQHPLILNMHCLIGSANDRPAPDWVQHVYVNVSLFAHHALQILQAQHGGAAFAECTVQLVAPDTVKQHF